MILPQDTLRELSQRVASNDLENISREDLERFVAALCFSQAYAHFSGQQFHQVCETMRLLLLKQYMEDIDKKNTILQRLVILLTIIAVIGTAMQVYYADKSEKRSAAQEMSIEKERQKLKTK